MKLKCEHITDPHIMWKTLKSGKFSFNDFTASQKYQIRHHCGLEFDNLFNESSKKEHEERNITRKSQNQIKKWKTCQRFWYFDSILHLKGEVTDEKFLKFGKSIHLILSKFYETIDIDESKRDPISHFNYVLEILKTEHWDYTIDEKLLNVDAKQIFTNFAQIFGKRFAELNASGKLEYFFPISVEEDIYANNYPLRSIIDRINKDFKTFGDYKTNKKFPDILLFDKSKLYGDKLIEYENIIEDYNIQAAMNAICINDKYGVWPNACLFIFLRHMHEQHGGIINIPITQEIITTTINYVNEMYEAEKNSIYKKTDIMENCTKFGGCIHTTTCDAMEVDILEI